MTKQSPNSYLDIESLAEAIDAAFPKRAAINSRYLGDGVYASFDGYQIWLHVGAHTEPPVVALEAEVLEQLVKYNAEMRKGTRR